MLSGGFKGPCPVCGAPEMSCAGGPPPRAVIGAGFFSGAPAMAVSKWRSREAVDAPDPVSGGRVQVYGVGTPIPLIEALRQGVARWDELDGAEVASLAAHGVLRPGGPPPEARAEGPRFEAAKKKTKSPDRPPKDKMVREGTVVRK